MGISNLELPGCAKQISYDKTNARNKPEDPTGVIHLCIRNSVFPSTRSEVNLEPIIVQTLEGYVLSLLPTVPLHIHNIHLKCETISGSTNCYPALSLPSYKKNIGKYQVLDIDNIPVSMYFILTELLTSTLRIARNHLDFKQREID